MRRLFYCVAALLSLCVPQLARAEHDGNELSGNCTLTLHIIDNPKYDPTGAEASRSVACISLVRGVKDTLMMWDTMDSKRNEPKFHGCIPDGVGLVEAIKVVMKYINDNPAQLHQKDTILIHIALVEGYPCSASGTVN